MKIKKLNEDVWEDEEEEETTPSEEYYDITVGYVETFKVRARNEKEALQEVWKYKWEWNEELFDPEIINHEEVFPKDPEEYIPVEELHKSFYIKK